MSTSAWSGTPSECIYLFSNFWMIESFYQQGNFPNKQISCEQHVRILMSLLWSTWSYPTLIHLPSKLAIYTTMSESTNYRTESVFCHFRSSLRAPDLARLLNIYPRFPPSLNSKFGDGPKNCRKSLWSAAVEKFLSMLLQREIGSSDGKY